MLVEKIVAIKVKRLVKKRIIIKVDDDLEVGVLVRSRYWDLRSICVCGVFMYICM